MPKIAAFAMLMRLLVGGLDSLVLVWQDMLIIIALLSIVVGNLIAIAQDNLKRMLAYSTIAHMGFMLLGILSGSQEGYTASLFYVFGVCSDESWGFWRHRSFPPRKIMSQI